MLRWIFNILTLLSLLLMLASAGLWIRSTTHSDRTFGRNGSNSTGFISSHASVYIWLVTRAPEMASHIDTVMLNGLIAEYGDPPVLGVAVFQFPILGGGQLRVIRVGHWHLVVLFSLLPLWWTIHRLLRPRRRRKRGQCVECGYSLHGSSGACPECGAVSATGEPSAG